MWGKLFLFVSVWLVTSCCYYDPRMPESTPCFPDSSWKPCKMPDVHIVTPPCVGENPLSPEELIDIALSNNPETRITWADARSASYRLQAAKSSLFPTIEAELGWAATYQQYDGKKQGHGPGVIIPEPGIEDDDEFLNPLELPTVTTAMSNKGGKDCNGVNHLILTDLSICYLLFDFGGRCGRISSAREALHRANWIHNRKIQSVMLNTLISYYAFLEAKAEFEALKDDLEDAEVNLEAATELYQAGVKTKVDMLQSKSQLVNIQVKIEEVRGRVKTERGNLANAMGLPADTPLNVQDLPEELPVENTPVEKLMEKATKCRPDLMAAEAEYQKRQAELKVANSEGLPTLCANAGYERADAMNRTACGGYVYSGGINLEIPIFQGFYYTNKRRAAKSRLLQASSEIQNKESNVLLEVWRSYYAYKTAVETFKYNEEFLKYTEETYEAALGGYKEGTSSILDVLSAQKALSKARAQIIRARTDWISSLVGIAYATGTL